jgi:hypothetical protein
MIEPARGVPQTLQNPARIATRPEKLAPHVVVNAHEVMPVAIQESNGLRPDQPT